MVNLVGILNVTPDSFSDGNLYLEPDSAIDRVQELFKQGAALVDIGAESTKPNATPSSWQQEWQRLADILTSVIPKFPTKISLDSHHPETIQHVFKIGPVIINDVTGLTNPEMRTLVTKLKPTIIISHHPNTDIQTAHRKTPVDKVGTVKADLLGKANFLLQNGFSKTQIILDPGIGFGKTMELNWKLLKFAKEIPDYEVMIGYSRKRFLGENRMEIEPNIEAGMIAISHGAKYLRVHDVAEHAKHFL